jgi:hypothetical protein
MSLFLFPSPSMGEGLRVRVEVGTTWQSRGAQLAINEIASPSDFVGMNSQ